MSKDELLSKRFKNIKNFLDKKGVPDYRFEQILTAIFEQRINNFKQITTLPKDLKKELHKKFGSILTVKAINKVSSKQATKVLFELKDGKRIETVKMHFYNEKGKWNSYCLSTQVGCNVGCKFCTTGTIGLKRNLTVDEIVDQVLFFYFEGDQIDSISFMGMGEPLLNPDFLKALKILKNGRLFNMSPRKISVSTVGITKPLKEILERFPQVNVAFSLHTPYQKQREELIPVAKLHPIENIMKILDSYIKKNKRKVFLSYLMLKDVNDSQKHLKDLKKLILKRQDIAYLYHVNLIHYHSTDLMKKKFQGSEEKVIQQWKEELEKTKIGVTIRQSFGQDISAACGQLYAKYEKN